MLRALPNQDQIASIESELFQPERQELTIKLAPPDESRHGWCGHNCILANQNLQNNCMNVYISGAEIASQSKAWRLCLTNPVLQDGAAQL